VSEALTRNGCDEMITPNDTAVGPVLWSPTAESIYESTLGTYLAWLRLTRGMVFTDYDALWQWSVDHPEAFWKSIWTFFDLQSATPYQEVLTTRQMPGARWFTGASVNYARQALRWPTGVAVVARSDTREAITLSFSELRAEVARVRAGLQALGVTKGDRVAAYMPNIPEAVIACLAAASLGAVWSSCAPEFGVKSVIDRFRPLAPKLLLTIDGYRYGRTTHDRRQAVEAIMAALPSVEHTVVVPYLAPERATLRGTVPWNTVVQSGSSDGFADLPFDHPLYILFTSGTTGPPKAIVHGHGGLMIEHVKALALQRNLGPGSVLLQMSSTGWMVWNSLVSALLVGSTIICFDGDPRYPDEMRLWRLAEELRATDFASGAAYLTLCHRAGLTPRELVDLSTLASIFSTGSTLPADTAKWVSAQVSRDAMISSASGGTDVCSSLVGGSPMLPFVAGEISGRCLGVKVEAFDEHGTSIVGREGEMVVTRPIPSMPVGLWDDPGDRRLHATYFERFAGVWTHGDRLTLTDRNTCLLNGRSDATLNRAGIRMGTAEFYDVVERLPEVADSLIVHIERGRALATDALILLVVMSPGSDLTDTVRSKIRSEIRHHLSPRHVPNAIYSLRRLPRTLTGKKLEVPVKRILEGEAPTAVAAPGSILDADVLADIAALRLSEASEPPRVQHG